jgi:hypothetical protein
MIEIIGDLWEEGLNPSNNYDAILIPTNGFVTKKGEAVMGRGVAFQAKSRYPEIVTRLGKLLTLNRTRTKRDPQGLEPWNIPYLLISTYLEGKHRLCLFSFPVKPVIVWSDNINTHIITRYRNTQPGLSIPGWQAKADIRLIKRSAKIIRQLVDSNVGLNKLLVPKPGCGNGELEWKTVFSVLEEFFDDRFVIINRERLD